GERTVGATRIDREIRALVVEPEEDQRRAVLDPIAPRRDLLPIENRRRGTAGQRPQIAERQNARRRVIEQRGDPGGVPAALAGAVEWVAGKAVDLFHLFLPGLLGGVFGFRAGQLFRMDDGLVDLVA